MRSLPIAQYPEIAPPVVTVRAVYPGASAQTLEQTVAAPLENQLTGVEDMIFMSSNSGSNGLLEIQVTFGIGADADRAALNVNNRVKQAEARLPEESAAPGRDGGEGLLGVSCSCTRCRPPDGRFDDVYTSNYATLNILDALKRVPGTTNIQIFGAKDYAMRIWLRPDRLTQLKLTPADVARALSEQNAQFAAGKIGQSPSGGPQEMVYTITTQGRLAEVREFEDIIVRSTPGGASVRLKDVARVELGSKNYEFVGRVNGQAGDPDRCVPPAGRQRARRGRRMQRRHARPRQEVSAGPRVLQRVRHHALREGVDPRGGEDARRGHGAGVPGGVRVPAELARHAHPVRGGGRSR